VADAIVAWTAQATRTSKPDPATAVLDGQVGGHHPPRQMTAALFLALASSLAYGAADFLGGAAARGAHVLRVVVVAAPASLVVELLLWPAAGARFDPGAVAWGAASGLAAAAGFALLYRTLAIGPMSVLSPVTALVSAALPVGVGLIEGERLSAIAVGGMTLALAAVVVVSGGTDTRAVRPSRTALALAFGAGAAIALQLVCLDQAPDDSGVAPLLVGRAVSSAVVLGAAFALRAHLGRARPDLPASAAAGALDSLANFAFLLAVRSGDLAVVAVITALYPAGTVLLARALLSERMAKTQLAGLGLAAVAVSLLAVG
jgi:drug/metabolite transporter (DMT)-like permease